jgi:hypothetical protein
MRIRDLETKLAKASLLAIQSLGPKVGIDRHCDGESSEAGSNPPLVCRFLWIATAAKAASR